MAHKTLIDSTGYEVKSGRVLIAGTGYDIKKGRTLIDGTGYDIKFDVPVGELPVGSSVYMNVDGSRREFIIVQQGNPNPAIYDASCDGTWVLQKHIYTTVMWRNYASPPSYVIYYQDSTALSHLNNTVLKSFDAGIQDIIRQVKIPCLQAGYSDIRYGANGLSVKLFQLSTREVTGDTQNTLENDGTQLDFFRVNPQESARIAYKNGTATEWWLRSHRYGKYMSGSLKTFMFIQTNGYFASIDEPNQLYGERYAMILPFEAMADSDFNIIPS